MFRFTQARNLPPRHNLLLLKRENRARPKSSGSAETSPLGAVCLA